MVCCWQQDISRENPIPKIEYAFRLPTQQQLELGLVRDSLQKMKWSILVVTGILGGGQFQNMIILLISKKCLSKWSTKRTVKIELCQS